MFTKNLGTLDRTFRVVAGIALIAYGVYSMGTLGIILAVVGLVPLATGLLGNCPLYSVCNINTNSHVKSSCTWDGGLKS
jgi:hypothetical protein